MVNQRKIVGVTMTGALVSSCTQEVNGESATKAVAKRCDNDNEDPDFIKVRISNVRTLKRKRKSSSSQNSKIVMFQQKNGLTSARGRPCSIVLRPLKSQIRAPRRMMEASTSESVPGEPETLASNEAMQAPDSDQSPSTSDNGTFQLPAGSSSSAQVNHVPSNQPEIESPDYSDRTGRIESSVGIGNRVKQRKRTSNPPDRFGSIRNDLEGSKKGKKGSISSGDKTKVQPQQTVDEDQWLSNLDEVFEEIKDYEVFFSQIDSESEDLKDVLKVIWDAQFYEDQANTKFSELIDEGDAMFPKSQDSHDSRTNPKFEDFKKKAEGIATMADQRIQKLCNRYNDLKLISELSDLEDFMEKSLNDVTKRQKDDEVTTITSMENQQGHRLLEKEIRWRQGRIKNIKINITPDSLEIFDVKNRLKNVEAKWAVLLRDVGNEGKFYQFEKACEDNCTWFTNATEDVNNENYGDNADETEALFKALEIDIANGNQKFCGLEGFAKMLIKEGHQNPDKILQKLSGVQSLSNAFQNAAEERQNVLKKLCIFRKQSDKTIKFIEDKQKLVTDSLVNCAVDLGSLASQIKRHEQEEEKLNKNVKVEMDKLHMVAEMLTKRFPVVREHVAAKSRDCEKVWKELQELLHQRLKILNEAKDVQRFLENHAQVMDKITFWMNKVNGIQLCRNVNAARAAWTTCLKYEKEINEYGDVEELMNEGNRLLAFESNKLERSRKELTEKMTSLRGKWDPLKRKVEVDLDILKENLDALVRLDELQERKRLSELIGK